ncbi:MAG: hypothetical protein LBF89_12910 [Bacteroidales bacterium]|nr:hypothetical protein [Bacteroidales bacterium]
MSLQTNTAAVARDAMRLSHSMAPAKAQWPHCVKPLSESRGRASSCACRRESQRMAAP